MTQINWQYQVNNRAGGYIVTNTDWNDFAGNFRAFIDQTTGSGTTDNSPLPIGIDLVNDRVYISDPDSTTPEDANHADTTLSVVGTTTLAGNTQQTGTFTVGVDDTGHDVTFFGATASAKLWWDESADTLYAENSQMYIWEDSSSAVLNIASHHDTESSTPLIQFLKSDGSHTSPALVDDDASLGRMDFYGYDGDSYALGARIHVRADGTPSGSSMPAEMFFGVTPVGSQTPVTALTIKPRGESRFTADNDITTFAPNTGSTGDNPNGIVTLYNTDGAVDDFTCLDWIGNGTDAAARIGMKYTGSGSELHFGTSNSYGKGITHTGMKISPTGIVSPVAGAWKSWSPTLTNITIGNGAVSAFYCQFGDVVHWTFRLNLGSTTSFGGSIYFSCPVVPDNSTQYQPTGNVWLHENGSYIYNGHAMIVGDDIFIYADDELGTYTRSINVNGSIPFTWGTSDNIYAAGFFAVDF